jgi:starvation-inducible DNA-binding protein
VPVQPIFPEAHIPFPVDEREAAGGELQRMLVDLVDLSLLGKQAHWNVEGRHFRSLHDELDDLVEAWRSLGDEVAERAVTLGVAPDGQARTVAATSEVEPLPVGVLKDRDVVVAIADRLAEVVVRTRERLHNVSEGDPVTEDLLIQVAGTLEKQLWMVRAQGESA